MDEERFALAAGALELSNVDGKSGDITWRVGHLAATGAQVAGTGARFATAELSDVRLTMTGLTVAIDRVVCPQGLAVERTGVIAARIELSGLAVRSDDLLAIGRSSSGTAEAAGDKAGPARRPDLRFLDALLGHLHVDLFLHMSVPVLGERRGTHQFRVGITGGAISFQKVERDLAWLEDAFLDIGVSQDRLVIMQKIPLVPIPGTRLISWQLDPEQLSLAREQGLVHLSKLVDFELPQKRSDESKPGKKPKVAFHQIALSNIDIAADAAGPITCALGPNARFELGHGDHAGVDGLAITGEIVHRFGTASPATEVECRWAAVTGARGDFKLGSSHLSIAALDIADTRATVGFSGFRPGALTVHAGFATVEGVDLELNKDG